MELNHNGLRSLVFHTHDGQEMLATLRGEPGARVVEFFKGGRCPVPYGSVPLPILLRDPMEKGEWRCILAPRGDFKNCPDTELISVDLDLAAELAAWAQSVALGRAEGEAE